MERMNYFAKSSFVIIMCSLPILGYSDNNGDYFNNLPEKAILSLDTLYNGFTRIIIDMPDGKSDTIWIEAPNKTYNNHLNDGRRETICINTFKFPEIDYESKDYTVKDTNDIKEVLVNDAIYPKDALSRDIFGKIDATFIVEKDGSLSDIQIKKSLFPSIDKEAYRILSKTKLIPCTLGGKTFRCHHEISLFFGTRKKNGKTSGFVNFVNSRNLHNGIAKTIIHKITREVPGKWWKVSLNIDIPDNNNLEKLLCKSLFGKEGVSLEETGNKFAETCRGKYKNIDIEKEDAYKIIITAHLLGYKREKYYSYAYSIDLDNNNVTHNILYDIQGNRLLSANDIFSPTYLKELCNDMGFADVNKLEIGMDDYFLYIGEEKGPVATISLVQDNYSKFSPIIQNILGNKTSLPLYLNENDFDYSKETNYVRQTFDYGGGNFKTIYKAKGLKTKKEGIQPVGIHQRLIRRPAIDKFESLFHEYLSEVWSKNEIQPDSDGFVANISFVLNKNQTISNFQTKLKSGDELFFNKFLKLISNTPKWKTMLLAIDGPTNNYFNYDVGLGGRVYVSSDQMPEYPGGYSALYQWIGNEINMTDMSTASLKEGKRIFVSCIIDEDGSICNAKVESAIDDSLKNVLEKVLAKMPKWNPGKKAGKNVRVKTAFPLKLSIAN